MLPSDESVAVVVVTYNSSALLKEFVASLEPAFDGISWHLIVVDNASADATLETARRLAPGATVVEMGRNAGYAAGINAGVRAAGPHTAVLVLNPDVRLGPRCMSQLLTGLRRPGTGIAVPRLLDARGQVIESMRREPSVLRALGDALFGASRVGRFPLLGEMVTDRRLYEIDQLTDWAEGSTQLISKECWTTCGPWDESFFLYSEETEFDLRARDNGLATRYVASARAVHLEGDSAQSPGLWALLTVNRIRLFALRNGPVASGLFWAITLLRESSRSITGRRTSRAAVRSLLDVRSLRQPAGPHSVLPR